MRERATRVVPSAIPKSSPARTSRRAGRRGGWAPRSVEAMTERADRGRSSVTGGPGGALRGCVTCIPQCNISLMVAQVSPDSATPAPRSRLGGMVPPAEVRPDVLPSDRLNPRAKPIGALRDDLRRIPQWRNAANVVSLWVQSFGLIALMCWVTVRVPWPAALVLWAATFLLMGRAFALYAILAHEAAHRLLFRRRRLNDTVGRWVLAYPAFVPLDIYRRAPFAHHREEFGPDEPDTMLYAGYPIGRDSFRRKLR